MSNVSLLLLKGHLPLVPYVSKIHGNANMFRDLLSMLSNCY